MQRIVMRGLGLKNKLRSMEPAKRDGTPNKQSENRSVSDTNKTQTNIADKDWANDQMVTKSKDHLEKVDYLCGCGFKTVLEAQFKAHVEAEHECVCLPRSSHFLSPFYKVVMPTSRTLAQMRKKLQEQRKKDDFSNQGRCQPMRVQSQIITDMKTDPQEENKAELSNEYIEDIMKRGGQQVEPYLQIYQKMKLTPNKSFKNHRLLFSCGKCKKYKLNRKYSRRFIFHCLNVCETVDHPDSSHLIEPLRWEEQVELDVLQCDFKDRIKNRIISNDKYLLVPNKFAQDFKQRKFRCGGCHLQTDSSKMYLDHTEQCNKHFNSQSTYLIAEIASLGQPRLLKIDIYSWAFFQNKFGVKIVLNRSFKPNKFFRALFCGDCKVQINTIYCVQRHLKCKENGVHFQSQSSSHFFYPSTIKQPEALPASSFWKCSKCLDLRFDPKVPSRYIAHMLKLHKEVVPRGSSHVLIHSAQIKKYVCLPMSIPNNHKEYVCACKCERSMTRTELATHIMYVHRGISPIMPFEKQDALTDD